MFIFKLLFKNAFRHRARALLTITSIVIALIAFGLLRTLVSAWYAGVEASSSTRLVTRNSISLIFPLPLSYKEKIRQVEGVKAVSYGSWFGGIYIDEKHFFASFAVDPKTYFPLYPELVIDPAQKEAFLRDRKGFIAGRKLADKYGWKIGDSVTLKGTIYPGDWDFVLRGIYRGRDQSVDESQFIFSWDYLNESNKKNFPDRADKVGFYMVGVKSPDIAPAVSKNIDDMFRNSLAETLTETEKAFQLSFISMTEAILAVIQIVSILVIVIIMAVAANTMAMNVRERTSEYAVMKTLGFGSWRIAGLITGEAMIVSSLGCAFGILLTFPVAREVGRALAQYFPIFNINTRMFVYYFAASLLVGLVSAILPAWRATRISIAEGLRRIG